MSHDETLGAAVQPASGLLVLSASRIRAFNSCPRRFYLAHVLKVPAEDTDTDASVLGHAVHRELYERHRHPELHNAVGVIADDVPLDSFITSRIAAHSMLCPHTVSGDATYLGGEVDLRWLVRSKNMLIVGRADALWRHADTTLELRDYKTGQCPDDLDNDLPALVYLLLAATHASRPKAVRVTYERLGPNPSLIALDATADKLRRTIETLKNLADKIRKERTFLATPSESGCASCPYSESCPHAEGNHRFLGKFPAFNG